MMFNFKLAFIIITIIGSALSQQVGIRVTESESYENGNLLTLMKHKVRCAENEVLSFWTVNKSNGMIWYKYYCISGPSVTSTSEFKYTAWNKTNKDINKSLNYLDRHFMLCNEDEAIGAFEMEKSAENIRYKYRCNKVKASALAEVSTEFLRSGHGEVQGIVVHDVTSPKYVTNLQALRGWRMHTKYTSKWCTIFCDSFQDIKFDIFYSDLAQ